MKEIVYDVIFDVGVVFSADKKRMAQEERLRALLELDPKDALSAANLGTVLIQRGEYAEKATPTSTASAGA